MGVASGGEGSNAGEVVGCGDESEVPVQFSVCPVSCLAHLGGGLEPAEEAFDPLALLLTGGILGPVVEPRIDPASLEASRVEWNMAAMFICCNCSTKSCSR
jgi:hypothetical protein